MNGQPIVWQISQLDVCENVKQVLLAMVRQIEDLEREINQLKMKK